MTVRRWPLAACCVLLGLTAGLFLSQRLTGQPAAPPADPALPRDWMSYSLVVKRTLPAVVCIEGQGKAAKPRLGEVDPGFGSGVLINPAGIVLTNNHVVANTVEAEVTLQDGRKLSTREIRRDAKSDLAVLKLDSREPLPFLEFGDSDAMEVGDRVLALGAPFGLTGSVTQGIISAKSRQNLNLNVFEDFLQIDAAVNPGNSGGPLVNMEGKVVGLTSAIKTRTGGFQGVGLAVSSKLAKAVAAQLVRHGGVRRPYLGVAVRELDGATAMRQRVKSDGGVVVTRVTRKSPGERANIGEGDVITAVNAQPVTNSLEMQKAVLALPVGKEVPILVIRNGTLFRTAVVAEEQADAADAVEAPKPDARPTIDFDAVGVAVAALTADAAARLGLPRETKGVVVAGVTRGGLAEQSGLARGAIILNVDRSPVATPDNFRKAVEQATRDKGAVLEVLRQNGAVDFVILKGQ